VSEDASRSWQRAQVIFADALELPEGEREAYIAEACAEDPELLLEVRSLLEASRGAGVYFDVLADRVAEAAEAQLDELTDPIGRMLGHFEVRALLGEGGMGRVYRAYDARLAREVALKMLPPELAGDADHVTRFRREAQVIASLNHPLIASIYGVEEIEGRIFLVLELVEGPTLADLLAEGPLPPEEAYEVGRQVAEALEAAHDIGIVHRDLKPANVKLGADGSVRVLDFGIAKRSEWRRTPGSYLDASPSTPLDMTTPGSVIGTASYMSPEQARGKPIDQRSDVWSFGALLYELLAGEKAFGGDDRATVLSRVLQSEPDWGKLPDAVPEAVRRLLGRTLEKQVRRRLQAIGEARIVLEDAVAGLAEAGAGPDAAGRSRRGPWLGAWAWGAVAAAGVVVGIVGGSWFGSGGADGAPQRTFRLAVSEDADEPVLSPGGDKIVYTSDEGAWVVFLDDAAPRRLEDTGGGYGYFWSPDGESLGFLRGGAVWRVPVAGGAPRAVATPGELGVFAGTWMEDRRIAVATREGVAAYPETGGLPTLLWRAPETETIPVGGLTPAPGGGVLMVRERTRIWRVRDGEAREVYALTEGSAAGLTFAPPGHVLFLGSFDNPGIWALPVTRAGDARGDPFRVANVAARPSASRSGDLLYFDRRTSLQQRNLVWVDRSGQTIGVVGEPQARVEQIDVSPSGRFAAVAAEEGGRRRIWVHDVETGERFALSPMPDPGQRWPRWAPDERSVTFRYDKDGDLYFGVKSLDPGARPLSLGRGWYPAFARDGRILFVRDGDIYRVDPDRPDSAEVFIGSALSENTPRPSSNGLVAYAASGGGASEIFVTRYEDPTQSWQVSQDGGEDPKWRGDGRELFFTKGDTLLSVSIEVGGGVPRIGRPKQLFAFRPTGPWGRDYDPHPDGSRFLMLRALPRYDIEEVDAIVLVQNWASRFPR